MSVQKILDLARLKSDVLVLEDVSIKIVEPTALQTIEAQSIMKENGKEAVTAFYLRSCCFNEDGTPIFSKEEAEELAKGSRRVTYPLIQKILQWHEETPSSGKDGAPSESSSSS